MAVDTGTQSTVPSQSDMITEGEYLPKLRQQLGDDDRC
jgi:hypothetical protein